MSNLIPSFVIRVDVDQSITEVSLPRELIDAARMLIDQPAAYFLSSDVTMMLPVGSIVARHFELKSAFEAVRRMEMAEAGLLDRRCPLAVARHIAGFILIDGNATFAALVAAGWTSVPCLPLPAQICR